MLLVREFYLSILVFKDERILQCPENADHKKGRTNCDENG
jgi:hypothetical protein